MATHRVGWPDASYFAEAEAYAAAANAHYAATYEPEGLFTQVVEDKDGHPNCHYYGPPYTFDNVTVEEPPEVAAERPNGTVSESWEPPEED